MSIRKIITFEDPELRRVAKPVDKEFLATDDFRRLAEDMRDTLADSGGIGLAAPQIAESKRIVLFDVRPTDVRLEEGVDPLLDTLCINPELSVRDSTLAGYWEGCLSVPGYVGWVERPQGLTLSYLDENGIRHERALNGFLATVCQHEMDHLDGILYIDRIVDPDQLVKQEDVEEESVAD